MESFDIFCFAGRILLGHGGNGGLPARQVVAGGFVDGCRPGYLYGFHRRDVGVVGTTAVADDGGDAFVVFILSSIGRNHHLQSLEVQMDSRFQFRLVLGVCLHQYF